MTMQFDQLVRLGKLMDRAVHPSTSEFERQYASKMAHALCEKSNTTPSDAIMFDNAYIVRARGVPNRKLFDRIAELEIALSLSEDRERALAATHLEERDSERSSSLAREAALRAAAVERDAVIAQRDTVIADLEAQLAARKAADDLRRVENPILEPAAPKAGVSVEEDEPESVGERPEPSHFDAKSFKRNEWRAFVRLASAGLTKLKIARELTRILGRVVTAVCVKELMRLRWSPSSGWRFALRAPTLRSA